MTELRLLLAVLPALLTAWWVEVGCARRGVLPPGFRHPLRRWIARLSLAGVFWVGVFVPLGMIGAPAVERDLSTLGTPRLFLLHGLLVAALFLWMLAGFGGAGTDPIPAVDPIPAHPTEPVAGVDLLPGEPVPGPVPPAPEPSPPPRSLGRRLAAQLGFVVPSIGREIGLGLLLGIGAWAAVLAVIVAFAGVLYALGGQRFLPHTPPQMIPFVAGLPFVVRALLSLSAGVVEETFFRGFLQPRIGIALSTGLFVLAHASYGQPFMLVGVGVLSLIYALLVRWRQSIWAAIAAHALFDGVQLLVIIPIALKVIGTQGVPALPALQAVAAFLGIG